MQYCNQLPSAYSQLKIQIVSVETEIKEKLEELNKKINDVSSPFNTQLQSTSSTLINQLTLVFVNFLICSFQPRLLIILPTILSLAVVISFY
jgi:hypothetical protein